MQTDATADRPGSDDESDAPPGAWEASGDEPVFSVVAPAYNEEKSLPRFHQRAAAVMDAVGEPWELVIVDDGSTDGTATVLRALTNWDPRVRAVRFSRNFGHQVAISAGLDYARGQAVITLDADLQDPPEAIPRMIAEWRVGGEVVYAQRIRRLGESAFKRLTAALFYRLLEQVTTVPIPRDTGDFRLLDRRAVDVLRDLPERHRFVRGLSAWVGFRQVAVPYERAERFAGASNYPLRKMLRLAWDAITGFSDVPLRLASGLGLCLTAASAAGLGAAALVRVLGLGHPGWWLVPLLVTLIGGVQLTFLGVLGGYLARIYDEVRGRPLYIVREVLEAAAAPSVAKRATPRAAVRQPVMP